MKRTPALLLSARLQMLVIPFSEHPLIIRSPILFMISQVQPVPIL
jgi:hypothetical protein